MVIQYIKHFYAEFQAKNEHNVICRYRNKKYHENKTPYVAANCYLELER